MGADSKVESVKTDVEKKVVVVHGKVTEIKGQVTDKIDGVKGQATGKIDEVKSIVETKVTAVKGQVTGKLDEVKDQVTEKIDEVKGQVTEKIGGEGRREREVHACYHQGYRPEDHGGQDCGTDQGRRSKGCSRHQCCGYSAEDGDREGGPGERGHSCHRCGEGAGRRRHRGRQDRGGQDPGHQRTNAVVEVLDEATEATATPVVAVGPDEQ